MQNASKSNEWGKIGLLKIFKLKYRRATKYFTHSVELVLPKKLGLPSLFLGNLKTLRKVLLFHAECIEI